MTGESLSAGAGSAPALVFSGVSFRYGADGPWALSDVELEVAPGEVVALVGGNGSGKSTLARLANGLLRPQSGHVLVGGLSTATEDDVWELRARVGLLFQDPEDQIVGATVEDDVAFGLENRGVPRGEMRTRVTEVLAALGLAAEAATEPHLLSGGQKQRLALAGVVVLAPQVLVLDEPTSMLDPRGREEVLGALRALTGQGVGVLLITQHMDEALEADRLVALERGRIGWEGDPATFFRSGAHRRFPLGTPPVLSLAEDLGLGALPEMRLPLTEDELVAALTGPGGDVQTGGGFRSGGRPRPDGAEPALAVRFRDVGYTYNPRTPFARLGLSEVDLDLRADGVTALMGSTAAGKSTLLQLAAGLLSPSRGTVEILGQGRPRRGMVGMAFQRPEASLFAGTVEEDVGMAPRLQGLAGGKLATRVEGALRAVGLDPAAYGGRSPFSLSLGEQRRVALAGVLSMDPALLVLDEPGAGLDPAARGHLLGELRAWAERQGRSLVYASHDQEEVAALAERVVVLREGHVAAEGAVEQVLGNRRLLEGAGLRPPLAARVAARLGASPEACPIDAAGFGDWLATRGGAAVEQGRAW
jgi:energy-coupling factor transporter ATPase